MKVTARYTSPNPRTVVLGDMSLNGTLPMADITWSGGESYREQTYMRGPDTTKAFTEIFDEQNERNEFSWTVWREHSTISDAFQFVLDHSAQLRGLAQIQFTFTGEGGAAFSRFMANAKVVAELLTKLGVSNQWRYTVLGGEVLKSNPNT